MAKRNWFESIQDRIPDTTKFEIELPEIKNNRKLMSTLFGEPLDFKNVNLHITPFDEFMADLEGFGFQDKGDHYEMVTNLGGQKGETGTPDDSVKIELTGKNNRTIEITYEHSTSSNNDCFYSHSQKTSVTLPADADVDTVQAYFNDDDDIVVSVKKKSKNNEGKGTRSIPIIR